MLQNTNRKIVLLVILYIAYLLFHMFVLYDYGYNHGDEGMVLMDAWRIYLGQVPSADFSSLPPFSFYLTALAFKLLGPTFFAERLLVCLYAILLIVSSDLLLKHFTRNNTARFTLAVFLVPFGVFCWPMPSYHWVVGICQLLSLWALLNGCDERGKPFTWAFISGVFAALACFTLQDQGAYLVLAVLLLFFISVRDSGLRVRLFLGWASGGLLVTLIFGAYLLSQVPLEELVYQWIYFPMERYKVIEGNVSGFDKLGWQDIGNAAWLRTFHVYPVLILSKTFFTLFIPLLPLFSLLIIFRAWHGTWVKGYKIAVLAAGYLAFMGSCLHRFSQTYLGWAGPMLMLVICFGIGHVLEKGAGWKRGLTLIFAVTIITVSLLFDMSILHQYFTIDKVTVKGRGGEISVVKKSFYASMQLVIDAVEQHVPVDAPLFCTKYNPIINFWTQRMNPTPWDFISYPGMHTDEQVDIVIESFEKNPDTHVLLFVPIDRNNKLDRYVLDNYTPVWKAPWALLMRPGRKDLKDSPNVQ